MNRDQAVGAALVSALVGFLTLATGCVDAKLVVAKRASFDLDCPTESIMISEGGGSCTYYARGCGRKAAYILRPVYSRSMACCPPAGCDAILNSDIGPIEPSLRGQ